MAAVTVGDVAAAALRLRPLVHRTPVMTSSKLDSLAGRQLFFKAENFQKTGAFKARGACNAVFSLLEREGKEAIPGIVTHSSGNHGMAVAYASGRAGLPCAVVVPSDTPRVKCDAIAEYGARLVFCEPSPTARATTAKQIADSEGFRLVHPYDDPDVIAGQGTIGMELHEQVADLDVVLVPISGGGMTSGIAVATAGQSPNCRVIPVEPVGKGLGACLEAKQRLWSNPPKFLDTFADSIRTQQTGELTFPLLCEYADTAVITVTDAQMIEGMKLAFQRLKVVVEAASGAAVYAAVHLLPQLSPAPRRVGVILCGGNTEWLPPKPLHKDPVNHST